MGRKEVGIVLGLHYSWLGLRKGSRGTKVPDDNHFFFSSRELLFYQNSIYKHLTVKVIMVIGLNNIHVDQSIGINEPWVVSMSIMWSPVEDIIHVWFWRVSISTDWPTSRSMCFMSCCSL